MKSIKLDVGPVIVTVSDKCLVVAPRRNGRRHVTVFFAPQAQGRYAGRWTPHISDGSRKIWLARVPADAFRDFEERIRLELEAHWTAATRPIDLDDLSHDGWLVHAPTNVLPWRERLDRYLRKSPGRYSLEPSRIDALMDDVLETFLSECIDPLELAASFERGRPYHAIQISPTGDITDSCWLSPPDERCGDWRATSGEWLPKGYMRALLLRETGGKIESTLSIVSTFLGLRRRTKEADDLAHQE